MRRTTTTAALLTSAVLLLGACGGDDEPDAASTTTTAAAPASTTSTAAGGGTPGEVADFDWAAPRPTELGGGWTIADCEGDGPLLCLSNEDGRETFLEHLDFPAPAGDLRAHAATYVEGVAEDRTAGCPEGYRIDADLVTDVPAPDGPVLRYGFLGGTGDVPVERTAQWAGLRGDRLVIVTLAGYDPGACLTSEGEGSVADVSELLTPLDALIGAAGLPEA